MHQKLSAHSLRLLILAAWGADSSPAGEAKNQRLAEMQVFFSLNF
jgi:hypothetical protein